MAQNLNFGMNVVGRTAFQVTILEVPSVRSFSARSSRRQALLRIRVSESLRQRRRSLRNRGNAFLQSLGVFGKVCVAALVGHCTAPPLRGAPQWVPLGQTQPKNSAFVQSEPTLQEAFGTSGKIPGGLINFVFTLQPFLAYYPPPTDSGR